MAELEAAALEVEVAGQLLEPAGGVGAPEVDPLLEEGGTQARSQLWNHLLHASQHA